MIALAVVLNVIIALVVLGALAGYLHSLIREIAAELVCLRFNHLCCICLTISITLPLFIILVCFGAPFLLCY